MKLAIGSLTSVVLAFSSCVGLIAQEIGTTVELPTVESAPSVETFVFNDGVTHHLVSVPSFSFGDGNNLNILHGPSVVKDLELVDDQIARIADIRKEYGKLINSTWKEYSKAKNDQELRKEIQKRVGDLQTEQNEALSDVLPPHQLTRIKQVGQQLQMQAMGGASGALQHGQLAKELDITTEQKKRLAEIQKKMNDDIAAKTNEIQVAAKKEALEQLTADQKAKLNKLTGEEFKRNPKDELDLLRRKYANRPKK